jgi:hypothetical protein
MRNIVASVDDPRTSFKVTHDVMIPPAFQVKDREDCLKAGAIISAGGCIVTLSSENPATPLAITISTDVRPVKQYLPPRLKLVEEGETRTIKFTLSMAPRGKAEMPRSINVEDGWYLVPGSQRVVSLATRGAERGGIRCKIRSDAENNSYKEGAKSFSMTIGVDNNSRNDTGHCDYEMSYDVFRLKSVPI